jgi:hypothetical protein
MKPQTVDTPYDITEYVLHIYRVIHVRWRAWPGKNTTQNTLYKAFIVFW